MSRWIDADALKKSIDECDICNICPDRKFRCSYDCDFPDHLTSKWEMLINTQPSIDIVRCKECKHITENEIWAETSTCVFEKIPSLRCKAFELERDSDDFCSYGEKNEQMD